MRSLNDCIQSLGSAIVSCGLEIHNLSHTPTDAVQREMLDRAMKQCQQACRSFRELINGMDELHKMLDGKVEGVSHDGQ